MANKRSRRLQARRAARHFNVGPAGVVAASRPIGAPVTILGEEVTLVRTMPWGGARGFVNYVGPFVPGRGTEISVWLSGRLTVRCTLDQVRPAHPERANVWEAYDRAVKLGLGWAGEKLPAAEI